MRAAEFHGSVTSAVELFSELHTPKRHGCLLISVLRQWATSPTVRLAGGGMGPSFEIEDYGLAFDPKRTS
jgi:hypothetical protein